MIHEDIYKKLIRLFPDLERIEEDRILESPDVDSRDWEYLRLDILERESDLLIVAIAFVVRSNNVEWYPDPKMTLRVYPKRGFAEALTYDEPGEEFMDVYPWGLDEIPDEEQKPHLNAFLDRWLDKLFEKEGYRPVEPQEEKTAI